MMENDRSVIAEALLNATQWKDTMKIERKIRDIQLMAQAAH
jgi:hypothetical protein